MSRRADYGLLFMRLGLAAVLLVDAVPTILGGVESWREQGAFITNFGFISYIEQVCFFICFSLFIGAIALLLGFWLSLFGPLLALVLSVYAIQDGSVTVIALVAVVIGLNLTGPGALSFSKQKN